MRSILVDPSNTATPAIASHCAAAAAEVEQRIRAEIFAQRVTFGSPVITPPPEAQSPTLTGTTNQPLSPIQDEDDSDKEKLGSESDNPGCGARSAKTKQAHANGQS
jgi:hypothetical protein